MLKHSKCFPAVMAVLLLSACASTPALRAPERQLEVVSLEEPPVRVLPSPQFIHDLAALELKIAEYPVAGLWPQRWWYEVRGAELLARQGYMSQAQDKLHALDAEIHQQAGQYYERHAKQYLQMAEQFARLNDDQYGRLRALQVAYQQQDFHLAYKSGQGLVRELWAAQDWVTVRAGDTLARISARPQVYDNPNLWPLLMQANKGLVRSPTNLKIGWRLRFPVHPRLDEIFAAVEQATGQQP